MVNLFIAFGSDRTYDVQVVSFHILVLDNQSYPGR
jgi:hypothetical protein